MCYLRVMLGLMLSSSIDAAKLPMGHMDGDDMLDGGFMGSFSVLFWVFVILVIAALIKYLMSGGKD